MNCEESKRRILLADSGELPAYVLKELNDHVAGCAGCKAYRDDVGTIVSAAREALPSGEPSPAVLSRIRAAAEEQGTSRISVFRRPVLQVLAYAAAVALFLGGGWLMLSGNAKSERIARVHAIAAAMSVEETLDSQNGNGGTEEKKLHALARQLLIMEGLETEDVMNLWSSTSDGGESDA